MLIDLTPFGAGKGLYAQEALERAGITTNKNTIPNEPNSPFYPSGLRLGTPALTTRGMKEKEMKKIGAIMAAALKAACTHDFPESKEEREGAIRAAKENIAKDKGLAKLRKQVHSLCGRFPLHR